MRCLTHHIYIDCSEIREGRLEELKAAMIELAQAIKSNEPQLLTYNVYFSEDCARMTLIRQTGS